MFSGVSTGLISYLKVFPVFGVSLQELTDKHVCMVCKVQAVDIHM